MPKIRLSFFFGVGNGRMDGKAGGCLFGGRGWGGNRNLWRENNLLKAAMVASRA